MYHRIRIRRDRPTTEDGSNRSNQSDNIHWHFLLPKRMETSATERYVFAPRVNLCKIANVESSKSVSSSRAERSEVEGSVFIAGSATNPGAPSYALRRVGK